MATAIPNTVFDAKGDLIVGTAADTTGKLTVGTNGYFLKANSGTATAEDKDGLLAYVSNAAAAIYKGTLGFARNTLISAVTYSISILPEFTTIL